MHKAKTQIIKVENLTGSILPFLQLASGTIQFSEKSVIIDVQPYSGTQTTGSTQSSTVGSTIKNMGFDFEVQGIGSIGSRRLINHQAFGSFLHLLDLNYYSYDHGSYPTLFPWNATTFPYAIIHYLELDNE